MDGRRRTRVFAAFVAAVALMALVAVPAQTKSPPASTPPVLGSAPAVPPPVTSGPEQPIPFSHKVHAGSLQLTCESCHALSRSGETMAIPQAALCMDCHRTIATTNPGVQKLAAYAQGGKLILWARVYELPSFVTFSHKVHLLHGATCQECHGQVAQRDRLFQESDISMAGCLKCHRAQNASVGCNTCHMLEQ